MAVCMLSAHYVAKGVPTLLSTLGRKERTRTVTYAAWKKQDDSHKNKIYKTSFYLKKNNKIKQNFSKMKNENNENNGQ